MSQVHASYYIQPLLLCLYEYIDSCDIERTLILYYVLIKLLSFALHAFFFYKKLRKRVRSKSFLNILLLKSGGLNGKECLLYPYEYFDTNILSPTNKFGSIDEDGI